MATGIVKWFSNSKGYGFVTPDQSDTEDDVFVHFSVIENEGYKTLKRGERVEFELTEGPKGLLAHGVKQLDPQTAILN